MLRRAARSNARGSDDVECSCGCDTEDKAAIFDTLGAIIDSLWASGDPVDGPLVAMLGATASPATGGEPEWPLSWPITDVVAPDDVFSSEGTAIEDASDRSALRELRDASSVPSCWPAISVAADGLSYDLFLREELPPAVEARRNAFWAQ